MKNVHHKISLIRPLRTCKEYERWSRAAEIIPEWLDVKSQRMSEVNNSSTATSCGSILIKNACVVDSPRYLRSLWEATQQTAAAGLHTAPRWNLQVVADSRRLAREYDTVVLASGAGVDRLWNSCFCDGDDLDAFYASLDCEVSPKLRVKLVRGQNLFFDCKFSEQNAVLCGEYALPAYGWRGYSDQRERGPDNLSEDAQDTSVLCCGATHEHLRSEEYRVTNVQANRPDLAVAHQLLGAKLTSVVPAHVLGGGPIGVSAGVRVVAERTQLGRLPMAGRHPRLRNVWMLSGFGSRGLLHHALVAQHLVDAICADDEHLIPQCLAPRYRHSGAEKKN